MSLFLTTEIGANPVALGAFLLVTPISALVASTLIGRLSDARAVRRTLLVVGAAAGGLGYALFAVLRNYWVLLAVSATLVAVASSLLPQMFAYARQLLERDGSTKAPLAISGLRTLISVSWVAGPPVAAVLVEVAGFTGLFAASALFYAVVAVLASTLPELGDTAAAPVVVEQTGRGPGAEIVFASIAFVLMQGAVALSVMAMPLFVTAELHGTTGDAGLVLGLCAALEIPLMVGFGVLTMKVRHHRLVLIGAVVALSYHSVMLLTTNTWQVMAAQVLSAITISSVMGVGISYFQGLAPERPGYATTLFTNTAVVGTMLAGPFLGVAQQFGYRYAYAISLTMSVVGLVLILLARPRRTA
jgi:SET family sugar efflux transporter-like MFS transporter